MKRGFLLILLVSILGCTDMGVKPTEEMILAIPDEFVEVPNQPIDTNILYNFIPIGTGRGRPPLGLRFFTQRIYSSGDWRIINSMRRTDYRFTLSLERIQKPQAGRAIMVPASCIFDLGHLSDGAYSFDIHINGKTVRMAILVRNGQVVESRIQPNNYISERVLPLH